MRAKSSVRVLRCSVQVHGIKGENRIKFPKSVDAVIAREHGAYTSLFFVCSFFD